MNLLQNYNLAVIEYLYRGRRAVPLQTFTTRHNNRKLSTNFTQCLPETTKFGNITQNKGHFAVQCTNRKLIYDFLLVININLPPMLHRFGDTTFVMPKIAIFSLPLLRLTPRNGGVPLGWSPKNLSWMLTDGQGNGEERLPKILTGWVGFTNVTNDRQTDDRRTGDSLNVTLPCYILSSRPPIASCLLLEIQ